MMENFLSWKLMIYWNQYILQKCVNLNNIWNNILVGSKYFKCFIFSFQNYLFKIHFSTKNEKTETENKEKIANFNLFKISKFQFKAKIHFKILEIPVKWKFWSPHWSIVILVNECFWRVLTDTNSPS